MDSISPLQSMLSYTDEVIRRVIVQRCLPQADIVVEDVDVDAILHACTCLEKDPTSAKRQHVERNIGSPSDVARISGWTEFTKKVRHVYCHRPRHGFPVTLQVRAFGEFVDALKIDAELRYRKWHLI